MSPKKFAIRFDDLDVAGTSAGPVQVVALAGLGPEGRTDGRVVGWFAKFRGNWWLVGTTDNRTNLVTLEPATRPDWWPETE